MMQIWDVSQPSGTPSVYRLSRSADAADVAFSIAIVSDASSALSFPGFFAQDEFLDEFQELADEWHEDTAHLTSPLQITAHPSFLRIVGFGDKAVPLILHDMMSRGGLWFPALDAITNAKPVKPSSRGNFRAVAEDWLDWGRKNGFYLN